MGRTDLPGGDGSKLKESIKGLAKLRGRNEVWAEQAVREAASLTAVEGDLKIFGNPILVHLDGLDGMKTVRGKV